MGPFKIQPIIFLLVALIQGFSGISYGSVTDYRCALNLTDAHPPLESILTRLPLQIHQEISTLMLEKLAAGSNPLTLELVATLRIMGIAEETIRHAALSGAHKTLAPGRDAGLSTVNSQFLFHLPVINTTNASPDFYTRYGLSEYDEITKKLGSVSPTVVRGSYTYADTLQSVINVAIEFQDKDKIVESFVHLMRLGSYKRAIDIAAQISNQETVIKLAFLVLSQFYKTENIEYLNQGIDALRFVQGSLKGQAEQILFDLAVDLSLKEKYLSYALHALRSAGNLTSPEYEPLVPHSVGFRTKITNKIHTQTMRHILSRYSTPLTLEKYNEIRLALQAIGDNAELTRLGHLLFNNRENLQRSYQSLSNSFYAAQFFLAAKNWKKALKALKTEITETSNSTTLVMSPPQVASWIQIFAQTPYNKKALLEIKKLCLSMLEEQTPQSPWWTHHINTIDGILRKKNIAFLSHVDTLNSMASANQKILDLELTIRTKIRFEKALEKTLNETTRRQLILQAEEILNTSANTSTQPAIELAWALFVRARSVSGLLKLARSKNSSTIAQKFQMYLTAALLMESDGTPFESPSRELAR